jgi:hypothetical protein
MIFVTPLSPHSNVSPRSTGYRKQPIPITTELTGSHRCECASHDLSASGHTPALVLCRELLIAGANPDSALAVCREGVLALRIRSIREGARLTVKDGKLGTPKFRLASPTGGATASLMRGNGRGLP